MTTEQKDPGALRALAGLVDSLGLRTPTAEQAAIATAPPTVEVDGTGRPQPLLVVAGAGSGKTETLSLRATFMAAHYGIPPENILGLTFTRKAAGELEQRLRARLATWQELARPKQRHSLLAASPESSTYNGFALSIVQEFGAYVGIDPQVSHMGTAAAWQLMSEIIGGWQGELPPESAESTLVGKTLSLRDAIANQAMSLDETERGLHRLLERFEEAKAEAGDKAPYIKFHRAGEARVRERLLLLPVIEVFEQAKRAQGAMDFSDQVSAAIKVVEGNEEARRVLRERHQVVFLDEFQDTSVAQMRLLSSLFADHPVTAVGDPNQAIYGWRGASAASLDDFHARFNKNPDVPDLTLSLSTAWRNDRLILDVANKVAEPLKTTPGWAHDHVPAGVPARGEQVSLSALKPRKGAPRGKVVARYRRFAAEDIAEATQFVLAVRREAASSGEAVPTCAVLSRRRANLLPAVAALREAGVPAQLAAGEALLQQPAVNDLRAALEITADVGRSSSLSRLLANLDLGALDLRVLADLARSLSRGASGSSGRQQSLMLDAVAHVGRGEPVEGLSEAGRLRVASLAKKLGALRAAGDQSLVDQVEGARQILGLDAEALADPSSAGVPDALDQFVALAADFAETAPRASLQSFLSWLEVADKQEGGIQVPNVAIDPGAVQVMTIHAAKGLEWDAVAVIGMAQGSFPSADGGALNAPDAPLEPVAREQPDPSYGWWTDLGELPYPVRHDREHLPLPNVWDMSQTGTALANAFREDVGSYKEREERRLAYVALTRARSSMLLSGAWNSSPKQIRLPSPFLTEAAGVPFVDTQLSKSPTAAEIEAAALDAEPPFFPRDPGPARRASEQVAAQVMETMTDLQHSPKPARSGSRSQALAGLQDRAVAEAAALLLEEKDRIEDQPKLADLSPDQVLQLVGARRGLSVTDIAAFNADPKAKASELLRPVPQKPGGSAALGTAFHNWVEQYLRRVSFSSNEPEDFEAQRELGQALTSSERADLEQMQAQFMSADPTEGFQVVGLEVPFGVVSAGFPVRGRIDAVLKDKEGNYRLIDWKTRSTIPKTLRADTATYYQTQLQHYLEAWLPKATDEGVQVSAELQFVSPSGLLRVAAEDLQSLVASTNPETR